MPAHEVRETQSIVRLRVKEHKLFDRVIPWPSQASSINYLQWRACWSTIKMDLWSEHGPSQC
jgi:hypothetical protein